jgi:hypothetical protein
MSGDGMDLKSRGPEKPGRGALQSSAGKAGLAGLGTTVENLA